MNTSKIAVSPILLFFLMLQAGGEAQTGAGEREEISLNGPWKFRCDPDALGEHFMGQLDHPWRFDARWMRCSYDDRDWSSIPVPSCWQVEGHDYNGVAWYRREFDNPLRGQADHRVWLRFEGVDYFTDLWVNEHYLGSHEGYFSSFQHEITRYLKEHGNLLVVRVDSPNDINAKEKQQWQLKSLIKGALQRWDANNPEVNPGGIWNDVKLILTGPGAIRDVSVQTSISRLPSPPELHESVPTTAVVGVKLAGFNPALQTRKAALVVTLSPANFDGPSARAELPIEAVSRDATWQVPVDLQKTRLWYTWDLGNPCLYTVSVHLVLDGIVSDTTSCTTGFRVIERKEGWATYLNGIRIFQRGANYLSDQFLSTMTPARYEKDVRLLKEANLNTVHPFCVVEKQEFYDYCDRVGILVYQDFPMWLVMDNSSDLVRRATDQMRDLISQFGHHPCIFVWNCGSQPSVANFEKLGSALAHTARELDPTRIAHQANAIIDYQGVSRSDPVGDFGWKEQTITEFQKRFDWRVDTHQYYGWYYQRPMEALKEVPLDHLQLITEYGAQALPARNMMERIIPKAKLFPPDWRDYAKRCFQEIVQFRYIEHPTSLDQFIRDSQAYQARFIQYHTEYYRRLKFSPCNGAHLFLFNDCWPSITWSVVDYDRQPKEGFYALKRALAPLQALLEIPEVLEPGQKASQQLWVVNDFPRSYPILTLDWTIIQLETGQTVAADSLSCRSEMNSLAEAGSIEWTPGTKGEFQIQLRLSQDGETLAQNQYLVRADVTEK